MSAIESDIAALGARLVFVGSGTPAHAADFRDTQHIMAPLYVDPSLATYRLFAFKAGAASTFAPAALAAGARAFLSGHRQGAMAGSPLQQGGVVLMMPDGAMPYVYRSNEAGDHPASAAVLDAVRAALAAHTPRAGS